MASKLNGMQHWLLSSGLELQREAMKAEIKEIEANGNNAIMTTGYVDMICDEAQESLNGHTSKKVLKEIAERNKADKA
jgi:Flp pilus assembly protein CpaB